MNKKMNKPITHVVKRDGRIVPFDEEKIAEGIYRAAASIGGHKKELSAKLAQEVTLIVNENFSAPDMPLVNEIQDNVEKILIDNGHGKTAKAYIIYREYRRREKLKKGRLTEDPRIPYRTMYESLLWNLEHQCETIEKLNKIIRDGKIPELVKSFEQNYNRHIQNIAKEISQDKDGVKLIIVAGPSSSGKTTTTAKLAHHLNEAGLDTVALNLDHYFFDLEYHPKDEYGDYDFETPEALDITLINQHLEELIDGKTIKMPYYDFTKGKRSVDVQEKAILPNQVIIIDTLHGLYKPMTQSVPDENKVKVYIETISQIKDNDNRFIRWTDIRLLRRMVRDSATRGYDMRQTIGHWHYVRRSELKHIIPFQGDTDFIVNGSIPFELPYLKKFTFESLPDYIKEWQDDPKRRDAFIRAERVHKLLSQVDNFYDEQIIPWDSLMREFIGGSVLKLH